MKIFLGILLGLLMQKGLAATYSYSWWTSEKECRFQDYNKSMECLYKRMGIIKNLSYILAEPKYTFRKWEYKH